MAWRHQLLFNYYRRRTGHCCSWSSRRDRVRSFSVLMHSSRAMLRRFFFDGSKTPSLTFEPAMACGQVRAYTRACVNADEITSEHGWAGIPTRRPRTRPHANTSHCRRRPPTPLRTLSSLSPCRASSPPVTGRHAMRAAGIAGFGLDHRRGSSMLYSHGPYSYGHERLWAGPSEGIFHAI